jgi:hypothetical protein
MPRPRAGPARSSSSASGISAPFSATSPQRNGGGAWPETVRRHRRQASYTTVTHYYNVLKAFYSWVVREGFLSENIMKNVHISRPNPKIIKPYSLGEIRCMLAVCDYDFNHGAKFLGSRNRALILLLLDTGLSIILLLIPLIAKYKLFFSILMAAVRTQ